MKSVILALAPLAVTAQVLNLGSDLDYKVPYGLDIPEDAIPYEPPCEECINVYHPPHHGVDIDECDRDEEDGWHWVHPGTPIYPDAPPHVWTTSTVTEVHTSTIIDCGDDVPDCPGKSTLYTTVHVPATITVCPVPVPSESYVPPPPPTYAPPPPAHTDKIPHPPPAHTDKIPEAPPAPTGDVPHPPPAHPVKVPHPPAAESTSCDTLIPTPIHSEPAGDHGHPKPSHPVDQPPVLPPLPPAHGGPSGPHHPAGPSATPTRVAPPAGSVPPYPACGNTLCPEPTPGQPGTIGVPYPPAPTTPGVVTAGAAQNVERAGLAVFAGLLVAMI